MRSTPRRAGRAASRGRRGASSALLGALASLIAGCSGPAGSTAQQNPVAGAGALPPAVAAAQARGAPVDPLIVTADNAFGLSLIDALIPANGGANICISPLSAAMALQVLYDGAQGGTEQAMARALQLGDRSAAAVNADNAALEAALAEPDPRVALVVANSLWVDQSRYPVNPSFIETDQAYYGAQLGDLAGAPANVNAWADAETHGLIPQILPPDLPPSAFRAAIIANTLYFKGQWATAFDSSQTVSGEFTLSDGSLVSADLMHQSATLPYLEGTFQGSPFQAVRLPYGKGRLSMLIVLPQAGAPMGSFVAAITLDDLRQWNAALEPAAISIALPRFTASFSRDLAAALTALGMGVAFDPLAADFAALAPGSYVSHVWHSTVVEVGESGTTAAAGTGVTITTTVVGPAPTMSMDHPFFYAIEDDTTGELLFVGILMDPGQAGSS